ncbi:hypothetical protein RDABS01_023819 [Bienertia sinuspersici]
MDGSGVKLNIKALNHLFCNYSSLHFLLQARAFLSTAPYPTHARIRARKNHLLIAPSSLSLASRFSPLSTLHERVKESPLPYGVSHAMEPTPDSNNNNNLLQVVLVSPQIPGNTGCIARTCAASGWREKVICFHQEGDSITFRSLILKPGDWLVFVSETTGLLLMPLRLPKNEPLWWREL